MTTLLRKIVHFNIETGLRKEYQSIRHAALGAKVTKHFINKILKTGEANKNGDLFISEEFEKDEEDIIFKNKEYQKKYKEAMKIAKANGTYKPKENNKILPCAYDIEMKQMEKEVAKYKKEMEIVDEEARKAQIKNKVENDLDDYYRK